jgi:demethylmenaquinone methyltransferase/2-methoxy-6-polyprenyl-1,4-benzoquinol methylase
MPRKEIVREMFDHIAPTYDKLNHVLSMNIDKRWRRHSLREIVDGSAQRILDVACGTGDSTISIAKAAAEGSEVTGVDISEGMMALIGGKAEKAGVKEKICLQVADGEALPYKDGTFDRVTCAFGIRNFEHKEKGLSEFLRVLKPGGKAVILELSVPQNRLVRWAYDLYFTRLLPRIGGAVSGDRAAYRYLPASVHNFPSPKEFCRMMKEAGFRDVRCRTFTFGLCRLFVGTR